MPHRKIQRKIVEPPGFEGFKPYGVNSPTDKQVSIFFEEYEALKLADYENLNHTNAAKRMGVSRATFARIYDSARKKLAQALVEKKEIKAVYGNALLEKEWYLCTNCFARFTMPNSEKMKNCNTCDSEKIEIIKE